MDVLLRLWAQLRTFWNDLSSAQRFLVLAGATALIAAVGAGSYYSLSTDYQPLASGLAPDEAGAIIAQLETATIPHRLESGGSVILVPRDRWARARVELASRGVSARGGKGWEIFDEVSLGTPPSIQNVNFTRALQVELARSIMQLEPVAKANVLIARGESSPFPRDQKPATASVVLTLKSGKMIDRRMAAGIVSMVAHSVEGLRPENVTIIDSAGHLISDPRSAQADGLSASDLEQRRELETYLSAKAEDLLARHLGTGRALVRVSADLNMQKLRETRESFSPDEKFVKTEEVTKTESGSGGESRNAPGAGGNTARSSGGANGKNTEETSRSEYQVPRTFREMESRPGTLQRMTVAVMVDLGPREGSDRPLISLKEAEELVKQAVGFQTARDEIKVSNVAMAGDGAPLATESSEPPLTERAQSYVQLARNVVLMVAFVFLAATVWILARRMRASEPVRPTTSVPTANGKPAGVNGRIDMGNGRVSDTDSRRFLELAASDPQQIARVLAALLRGTSK